MSKPATKSKQQASTAKPDAGGAAPLTLATMPHMLKMSEVAAYLAISVDQVAMFRDDAELEFIDVGSPGNKKPRWRITRESLVAFEQRRQTAKKK